MTKEQLISDIILQVTQGTPSDDSEIEKDQVAFWINYQLHQLIKQEIDVEMKNVRPIPPVYIAMEDCIVIGSEDLVCQEDCVDRVYIELLSDVVDLQKDAGIVRLITDEGDQIRRTSVAELDVIKNLRFSKPSRTNLVAYRQLKKIFIEGIKQAELDFSKVTVFYVKKQDVIALADTDEVIMTDQIKPLLIDAVVQRLKLQIYGSSVDTDSDGADVKQPVYHNQIARGNSTAIQPEQ